MEMLFIKIRVRIKYVIKSICEINKPKLGDTVYYHGEKCALIQGVNNPFWDLLPLTKENLDKPKRDIYKGVYVDNFKMRPLYKRFKFSFLSTYKFLMDNWYSIDIRKPSLTPKADNDE